MNWQSLNDLEAWKDVDPEQGSEYYNRARVSMELPILSDEQFKILQLQIILYYDLNNKLALMNNAITKAHPSVLNRKRKFFLCKKEEASATFVPTANHSAATSQLLQQHFEIKENQNSHIPVRQVPVYSRISRMNVYNQSMQQYNSPENTHTFILNNEYSITIARTDFELIKHFYKVFKKDESKVSFEIGFEPPLEEMDQTLDEDLRPYFFSLEKQIRDSIEQDRHQR